MGNESGDVQVMLRSMSMVIKAKASQVLVLASFKKRTVLGIVMDLLPQRIFDWCEKDMAHFVKNLCVPDGWLPTLMPFMAAMGVITEVLKHLTGASHVSKIRKKCRGANSLRPSVGNVDPSRSSSHHSRHAR